MEIKNTEIKKIKEEDKITEKLLLISFYDDLKEYIRDNFKEKDQQQLLEQVEEKFLNVLKESQATEMNKIEVNQFMANLIVKIEENFKLSRLLRPYLSNLTRNIGKIKEKRDYIKEIENYSSIPFENQVMIEEILRKMLHRLNTYYNEETEKELRKDFNDVLKDLLAKQSNNWNNNSINEFNNSFSQTIKNHLFNKIKRQELTTNNLNIEHQWLCQSFTIKEQRLFIISLCYAIVGGGTKISPKEVKEHFGISIIDSIIGINKIILIYQKKYMELNQMSDKELEEIINKIKTK